MMDLRELTYQNHRSAGKAEAMRKCAQELMHVAAELPFHLAKPFATLAAAWTVKAEEIDP